MNSLARRIALSAFIITGGFAGANTAFAMEPMSKADCIKHAGMEKDATKKDSMMKECNAMAMKKDTMKKSTTMKSGTSDTMGTMAPKKK